ncbi:xanthine dehydrogenase family protein molybdopterin-binding subunit [Pseudaestuariivita atlantica]|uniref:Isoquinoline 1-oxidoreductase n=1 Tax=Pseudaestuariivita atlantica TaxID=1317121 RepID=A0A0L1JPQ7_9RHOB|nr:molybdopterin cofactor-binding domain-containing protein [Pseudaestuariivita atlantica]KNG93383.1 isoquinoline 1-oxidoreductase [Pseudaestuariivita atlantica]
MGAVKTFTRRAFLVGSVAIAGGVAFGTYLVRRDPANPLADDLAADEATFNPWVKIGKDAITLITPHVDLGQGSAHAQAILIAEEMDLEPGQYRTSFGQPSPAYWNTALAAESAPFRQTDTSFPAQAARQAIGALGKVLGLQVTGGSSTMPDSYQKLREAGAVARETLKKAASVETGIPVDKLATRAGAVVLPDGTELAYTSLAEAAARIEPARDVPLRDPSTYRLIGKPTQRADIVAKSTGTLDYGIDLSIDAMVHAAVRMSPRRSPVERHDAEAALAMRGVQGVYEVTNGLAVVADNTWRAMKAAAALDVTWAPAPYPAEQADHWAEVEASFTEDRLDQEWRNDGDVTAATGDVVEAEYRCPYAAHQPLEPINAIVRVTDDTVEVWSSHQMPRFLQQQVAGVTGHDADAVIFHNQYGGGSFGHRLEFDNITLAAEIANQMRGTPVKLTFSREEDFAQDYVRQIGMARGSARVRDGKVDAVDLQVATVSASTSQFGRLGMAMPGPDAQIVAGAWNAPYAIPSFRVRGYRVPELAPSSSWRSVGAVTSGFFMESFLDEAIHAAGADPLEERLRLSDWDVSRKVLEAVGEMSDWGSDLGPNRGRGLAMVESFGVPTAEVVEVTATERGIRIDKVFVAADVGRVVDPINFENHMQGGVVWGLGHAMNAEITYRDGMPEQLNYHAHEGMRLYQCPEIEVRGLENNDVVKGIGEPPTPPAAPALANAIFAATGKRLRSMPFHSQIDFV